MDSEERRTGKASIVLLSTDNNPELKTVVEFRGMLSDTAILDKYGKEVSHEYFLEGFPAYYYYHPTLTLNIDGVEILNISVNDNISKTIANQVIEYLKQAGKRLSEIKKKSKFTDQELKMRDGKVNVEIAFV